LGGYSPDRTDGSYSYSQAKAQCCQNQLKLYYKKPVGRYKKYIIAGFVVFILGVAFTYSDLGQNQKVLDLGLKVEFVKDSAAFTKGLGGRESISENQGMFFAFGYEDKHCMWMKDMNFA